MEKEFTDISENIPPKKIISPEEWQAIDAAREMAGRPPLVLPENMEHEQEAEEASPEPTEKAKPEKKTYQVGIIDASQLAEAQARDLADERLAESKEDRSKNWLSRTTTRIWKHNLAKEYYRQKEISTARKEILESGNLYKGEEGEVIDAHHDAMGSIVERFMSEYEADVLKKEEMESKESGNEQMNGAIKSLIKHYAGTPEAMSKEDFIEQRNRVLSAFDQENAGLGTMYADNLFDVAREIRSSVEHGQALEDLDFDVKVTLGQAREGLNTEMKKHTFDHLIERAQNSHLGKYFMNEGVIATAAALYSAGTFGVQKAARSKFAQWATFGGAAVASAGLAGVKESARLERERVQDMRERAKGASFDKDAKRREEFAQSAYETKNVADTITTLEEDLAKLESGTHEDPARMLNDLVDIESRISLGEQRKIDLFAYTSNTSVETERTRLLVARAKLKTALRGALGEDAFNAEMAEKTAKYSEALVGDKKNENSIEGKDKLFKKMKHEKVVKHFIKTALVGAAVGFGVQEGEALGKEAINGASNWLGKGNIFQKQDGIFSSLFKGIRNRYVDHTPGAGEATSTTALGGAARKLFDDGPRMPMGHEHLGQLGNTNVRLPEGVNLQNNPDGTYEIFHGSDVLADHVPLGLDLNGNLDASSVRILQEHGIFTDFHMVGGGHASEHAADYLNEHPELTHTIHRELWYDNNTPHPFDKNELQTHWGNHDTGLDDKGNYVFNVAHMTADGSYHHGLSINAQDAIKHHGIKMIFSLSQDTQRHVFEVPIDAHGNAIIDKDSPLAKLMFEQKDGHAVFTGKYAEVVQSVGHGGDGGEKVRILSSVIGKGHEMIDGPKSIPTIRMDLPGKWDYEVPDYIPAIPRTPLERAGEKDKKNQLLKILKTLPPEGTIVAEEAKDNAQNEENDFHAKASAPENLPVFENEKKPEMKLNLVGFNHIRQDLEKIDAMIASGRNISDIEEKEFYSQHSKDILASLKASGATSLDGIKNQLQGDIFGSSLGKTMKNIAEKAQKGQELTNTEEDIFNDNKNYIEKHPELFSQVESKKPEKKKATKNEQPASDKELEKIAQKLFDEKKLTKKEEAIVEKYGQEITTKFDEILEKGKVAEKNPSTAGPILSVEDVMSKFNSSDDAIVKEYLIYADKRKDASFLDSEYKRTHNQDGTLNAMTQRLVDQIKKIQEEGKKEQFESTANDIVSYTKKAFKSLGVTPSSFVLSKSGAYKNIADRSYRVEHPNNPYVGETIADPLEWKNERESDSHRVVQDIADQILGQDISYDEGSKEKILASLNEKTPRQEKDAKRIRTLLSQNPDKIGDPQMAELGRLIRVNRDIKRITP
jgi:hypothetical protein